MLKKLTVIGLLVVFLASCQLHLALLQVVAWGNMLYDYSQGRTVAEAVDMTFSGQYPCEMCSSITAAQSAKSQDATVASLWFSPLLLIIAIATLTLARPKAEKSTIGLFRAFIISHKMTPPTPPPRVGLAY